MTYAEAFGWIMENIDIDSEMTFDEFLTTVRENFYSQGLIDTLLKGVETDFQQRQARQLTLEKFFEELRPQD